MNTTTEKYIAIWGFWLLFFVFVLSFVPKTNAQSQIAICDTFIVHEIGDTLRVNTDPVTMRVRADIAQTLDAVRLYTTAEGYYRITTGIDYSEGQINESLDRVEGAKYVGIVTGYYHFHKGTMHRFFEIPIVIEKSGWFRRRVIAKPGPLNIILNLGAEEIR